jgi:aminomethyltransferase
LSLQGPIAVDFLAKHVPGIRDLKYFHHMPATLFGKPGADLAHRLHRRARLRTVLQGEDAGLIWDTILAEGKPEGIVPACFTTLDYLRVESSLLFYPYDMSQMYPFEHDPPGDSLWELGLDFTVSPGKNDFHGADAHYRLKGKERFKIFGLLVEGKQGRGHGRCGLCGRQEGRRRHLRHGLDLDGKSMAIARLEVPQAVHGTKLELRGKNLKARRPRIRCRSTIPEKKKRTAVG